MIHIGICSNICWNINLFLLLLEANNVLISIKPEKLIVTSSNTNNKQVQNFEQIIASKINP